MKYLIKRDVCLSVSDCCQTLVVFDLNSGKSNSTFSSLFTFHPLIFFPLSLSLLHCFFWNILCLYPSDLKMDNKANRRKWMSSCSSLGCAAELKTKQNINNNVFVIYHCSRQHLLLVQLTVSIWKAFISDILLVGHIIQKTVGGAFKEYCCVEVSLINLRYIFICVLPNNHACCRGSFTVV